LSDKEDLRAAATIATSLSGFVMAGALALLGAEAAIFVFLLDKKMISFWLWGLLLLCFCSLLFSCYLGGRGVWKIYADGAKGTWRTTVGGLFAFQFVLSLLGLILLIVSSIVASSAPVKQETKPEKSQQSECPCGPVPKPKSLGQPSQELQPSPVVPAKPPSTPSGN
jgi:uncharacterized membrane protein